MSADEDQVLASRIFACPQCPKIFATRSNLKRHMENPNIHNIPYVRSRDQKRWKGHSKKVVSKEETTESNNDRMRKWRAENREKNRRNDLRCRVYRLARQKYGENDSNEKQGFVREEIARRLGRRMLIERRESTTVTATNNSWNNSPTTRIKNGIRIMSPIHFNNTATATTPSSDDLIELPFYSVPQQKIELPSIDKFTRTNSWSSLPPDFSSPSSSSSSTSSSPILPHLSPALRNSNNHSQRRSSDSSISTIMSDKQHQIKKERRQSSSSILTTAANAALFEKKKKHVNLSVNITAIPSSSSSSLLTPTSITTEDDDDYSPIVSTSLAAEIITEAAAAAAAAAGDYCVLPSMHTFLSYAPSAVDITQQQQKPTTNCIPTITTKGGIKYVDSNKILDEFVGVVLNYVDNNNNATVAQ